MYYIYFIQNKINDKVYVGQTKNIYYRLNSHRYELKSVVKPHPNIHLQNAWNKYGEKAFEFYEVASFFTREEVTEAEEFYRLWFTELELSYNIRPADIRQDLTEETKQRMSNSQKNRVQPEEVKQKISISLKKKYEHLPPGQKYDKNRVDKQRKSITDTLNDPNYTNILKGKPLSEEHKIKAIKSLDEYRKKNPGFNIGRKVSNDTKEKCRLANTGRKHSEESKNKMIIASTGRDCGGQKFDAFGESKTIPQWLKDNRCVVGKSTLNNRLLRDGWEVERALTLPIGYCEKVYEAFGELKTLIKWSKDPRCTVTYGTLKRRVYMKWSMEKALTHKV